MGWDGNKLADAMRRKRNERDANAVAAMRGVTADPPEGAVLELVEAAQAAHKDLMYEWGDGNELVRNLDAALSRFRVEDGEGA